jgi:hypothetical protein
LYASGSRIPIAFVMVNVPGGPSVPTKWGPETHGIPWQFKVIVISDPD